MGQIVFAAAMSHVLDPDYYQAACGLGGRRKVEACMAEIRKVGDHFLAQRPQALLVVADDHLNAFSFNAVPALCVRIGRFVDRMIQEEPEAFDKVLDSMPPRYALHEELANRILEDGVGAGFDLAFSADPEGALDGLDLTEAERAAFLARDMRRINALGGYLHLVMSVPGLAVHITHPEHE